MPAPFEFPASTAKLGLPLLFTGQAQKEFFVNQAFALIDAMMHQSVAASLNAPPSNPDEGSMYRITAPASVAWSGKEDSLAIRIAGAWNFVDPHEGMRIFDQNAGQFLVFKGQWETGIMPAQPNGGAVIDVESRAALSALMQELARLGIIT
jgi:hypothetical protein